jgi:hypothetical protein
VLPKALVSAAARRAGCTDAAAEGNMHSCIFRKAICCRSKGFRELQRVSLGLGAAVAGHSAVAAVHNCTGERAKTRFSLRIGMSTCAVKH